MQTENKGKKVVKERKNFTKKEKKTDEVNAHLTYNLEDKLDELFPQFKSLKKKEEDK